MLSDLLLWNKIGRIVTQIVIRMKLTPEAAFDLFYESKTCERLHDPEDYLYLMGDLYIVDELEIELQQKAEG